MRVETIERDCGKIMSATGREPSYVRKKRTRLGRGLHAMPPWLHFWRAGRSLMLTMNQLGLTPTVLRPL